MSQTRDMIIQGVLCSKFISYIKTEIPVEEKCVMYFISHGWRSILRHPLISNNIKKILFTDDPHAYFLNTGNLHSEKTLTYIGEKKLMY